MTDGMIQFDFDKHCYGCGNCANICPVDAIQMIENEEGFLVPQVDRAKCIDCGACDRQCIYLNAQKEKPDFEEECYALYGSDKQEDVMKSSSGGVFPALARKLLEEGGSVCGCVWNEQMEAEHIVSNQWDTVQRMLHSKYSQSNMKQCYQEVRELLKAGKKVLFSGTPCQIAAVLLFTGNPENLITCDVICKGVPSPGVWKKYVEYLEKEQKSKLRNVVLRSKHKYGWTGPVTRYEFEDGSKREDLFFQLNHFIVGFLDGLYMRNSCYECQYKDKDHQADIVLGDFWGINRKDFIKSKNQGVSAVIIRTEKGKKLFDSVKTGFEVQGVSYQEMVERNPSMTASTPENDKKKEFFTDFNQVPVEKNITKHTDLNSFRKKVIRFTYRTGIFTWIKWIKRVLYH